MTKILLLEDETLVQMLIEDYLLDLDFDVLPASTLRQAFDIYNKGEAECAILDVNLGDGSNSFPLAEILTRDNFPFVFMSGYNAQGIEGFEEFPDAQKLGKPIQFERLKKALEAFRKDKVEPKV